MSCHDCSCFLFCLACRHRVDAPAHRSAPLRRLSPMLEVDIEHRLGTFALDIHFRSGRGLTTLFGRSGAGKTSVVNAVAGLISPHRGRIVVDGSVLTDTEQGIHTPTRRRRVGYVFQEGCLFPHLTVRQNLRFGRWVRNPRQHRRAASTTSSTCSGSARCSTAGRAGSRAARSPGDHSKGCHHPGTPPLRKRKPRRRIDHGRHTGAVRGSRSPPVHR
jgi:ABC transporter